MTPRQFETLLDRLGADLSAWPAADRRAAETLVAADPAAAALFAEAAALDALLREAPAPASARLRAAVLAIPPAHPRALPPRGLAAWLGEALGLGWRNWTAGLATASAAMLLGFVLGMNGTDLSPGGTGEALHADATELGAVVLAEPGADVLP